MAAEKGPENAAAHEALKAAVAHLQAGREAEGEAILRGLAAAGGAPADVLYLLGELARRRGDLPAARDRLRAALARAPQHLAACLALATVLAQLSDPAAEAAFRQALALAGDTPPAAAEAHYGLAVLAQGRGARAAAAAGYREALAADPRHLKARNNLGTLLLDLGDAKAAADCLRQAVAQAPGYLGAQFNLGNACLAAGHAGEAESAFRAAIALKPDFARAHNNLGVALQKQKRTAAAEDAFRRCLALEAKDADALRNLANILNDRDELDEAAACYRSALARQPGDLDCQLGLAEALIKAGDAAAALAPLDTVLAAKPGDSRTLSLKSAALAVSGPKAVPGAAAAEAFLVDHEHLVRRWRIADLAPFASLEDLNRALAEHVANHPSLRADVTTKHGLDTDEILADDTPAVRTLRRFIEASAAAFIADIGVPPGHPFPPGKPARYRFKCWGVRMWRQGYQVPHIHHNAWLSGVYYVRLPKAVTAEGGGQDGWIEFGRGEDKLYRHASPLTTRVRPEEGLLLTFPSYIWHRTIPFAGDEDRISIAFDVIGEAQAVPR